VIDPLQDDIRVVADLVRGDWAAMCVRAMAQLRLADVMDRPVTAESLAERTSADAPTLYRLLRSLADLGLVERDQEGLFSLTSRGAVLRTGHPSGIHSFALMHTWLPQVSAWSRLADAVRSGASTFEAANGSMMWETLSRDPAQETIFNAAMARRGPIQTQAVADACDLTTVRTLVDVGGGTGRLLGGLLGREPTMRGVLADRHDVVAEAEAVLAAAGVQDRCEPVTSDFFESVPAGGDAYVLSNILHDWGDDECARILGVLHVAMAPGARLWIVERVLDAPRSAAEQAELHLLDLLMLVNFGGRERTGAEYDALLTANGFDRASVHTTSTMFDVIETTRR
jgi:hypothetical protein